MLASWTADLFEAVLLHPQAQFWQIMHLTTLFDPSRLLLQIELALFAVRRAMRDHRIRCQDLHQGVSPMTLLATRWPATLFALLARLTPQPITGGRFTTVVAIFPQPSLQLFNTQ